MLQNIIIYSQEEINYLHDFPFTGEEAIVRDRCIIGYYHLLRAHETMLLRGDEVMNVHYFMLFPSIAGAHERLIPIHAVTRPLLEKYKYQIPRLDETFYQHYQAIIEKTGIKGKLILQIVEPDDVTSDRIHPYSIGYSARYNLLKQTGDPFAAQTLRFGYTSDYFKAERAARDASGTSINLMDEIKKKYFDTPIRGW